MYVSVVTLIYVNRMLITRKKFLKVLQSHGNFEGEMLAMHFTAGPLLSSSSQSPLAVADLGFSEGGSRDKTTLCAARIFENHTHFCGQTRTFSIKNVQLEVHPSA